MTQYLSVNPLSLSNEEIDELISDLNRIKSGRTILSSVSVLNEIAMKEKTTVKYTFDYLGKTGWNVVASIDINGSLRVGSGTDISKSGAKEKAATIVKNQVVYDRSFKKFGETEVSRFSCDTGASKKFGDNKQYNEENNEWSDNEYCSDDCECHYSEDDEFYQEEDERIGDCSTNPDWLPEWVDMSDEEKKKYLDSELDEYTSNRKHEIYKKFPKELVLTVKDSRAMNIRNNITDYISSLTTGEEQIHSIKTMESYDRLLDRTDIFIERSLEKYVNT